MVEIEDYVEAASEALRGNWNAYARSLGRELDRLGLTRGEVGRFITQLKSAARGEKNKELEVLENILADYFTIDDKQFTIGDLKRAKLAIPIFDYHNQARRLSRLRQLLPLEEKEVIPEGSIQTLIEVFERGRGETPPKMKQPNIKLQGFLREAGVRPAITLAERERIYNYWEEIYFKYDNLVTAMDDLISNDLEGGADLKAVWEKFKSSGNYVLVIDKEEWLEVPDTYSRANLWIKTFLAKAGVKNIKESARVMGYETEESGPIGEIDLEEMQEEVEDLITEPITVDPIFKHLIVSKAQKIPVSANDWAEDRERIEHLARKELQLDAETLKHMAQYLDMFIDEVGSVERDKFYLPINNLIHGKTDVFEIEDITGELLEELADFITDERTRFETAGYPQQTAVTSVKGGFTEREEFNQLLIAINEYYIEPLHSDYFYGSEPKFGKHRSFRELTMVVKDSPFTSYYENMIDNFTVSAADLDNIADFLELMRRGAEVDFTVQRVRNIKAGYVALNRIMGEKEEHKQLAGHMLYQIIKEAEEDTPERFKEFKGKPIEEWDEEWRVNVEKFRPLSMMKSLLESTEFRKKLSIKTKTRAAAVAPNAKKIIDLKRTEVEVHKRELLSAAQRILDTLHDMETSIMTSLDKLIYAHDIIRKMLGKPVIYGYRSLDNINDVDYILKQMPKYELSVVDLQHILHGLDSFTNIAKSHGINEDSVYTVKALCRGIKYE